MTELTLIVSPHEGHPNAFDARLATGELVCISETPLLDGARALLKNGWAQFDDVLVMRHRGFGHAALKATVAVAARLRSDEPKGHGRLRLRKVSDLTAVWPRSEKTESPGRVVPVETPNEPVTLQAAIPDGVSLMQQSEAGHKPRADLASAQQSD